MATEVVQLTRRLRCSVGCGVVVFLLVVETATAPLAAQQSTFSNKPAIFSIAPYVGYMNFGDYFESGSNVEFSNENGALYGAQAQLDLGRFVSLVGNFGYSSSKFTFENYFGNGQDLNLNDVGVWLYDGDLQLRLPLKANETNGISPFVQAGAGAIRYSSDNNDIASNSSTNAARFSRCTRSRTLARAATAFAASPEGSPPAATMTATCRPARSVRAVLTGS